MSKRRRDLVAKESILKTFLFRLNNQCVDVTGGWEWIGLNNLVDRCARAIGDKIYLKVFKDNAQSGQGYLTASTVNKIDLLKYKKIVIIYNREASLPVANQDFIVFSATKKDSDYIDEAFGFYRKYVIKEFGTPNGSYQVEIDITGLPVELKGEAYVSLVAFGKSQRCYREYSEVYLV